MSHPWYEPDDPAPLSWHLPPDPADHPRAREIGFYEEWQGPGADGCTCETRETFSPEAGLGREIAHYSQSCPLHGWTDETAESMRWTPIELAGLLAFVVGLLAAAIVM